MALFPAEVLVPLYQMMGDAKDMLVMASALNSLLIFAATLLLVVALVGLRRRRYGVLRALGAPPLYILLVVWMGAAGLIGAGCVLGLSLGWGSSWVLSNLIEHRSGVHLAFAPALEDLAFVASLVAVGSLLACIPAIMSYRFPIAQALRG